MKRITLFVAFLPLLLWLPSPTQAQLHRPPADCVVTAARHGIFPDVHIAPYPNAEVINALDAHALFFSQGYTVNHTGTWYRIRQHDVYDQQNHAGWVRAEDLNANARCPQIAYIEEVGTDHFPTLR